MKHVWNNKLRQSAEKKQNNHNKLQALILSISLLLVTVASIGGTLAYLTTGSDLIKNNFNPSYVSCQVTESFNGTVKSNVNVINTGDTDAYIRVKLVSYRVNETGQHIGGNAEVPGFTPGSGWVKHGEHFYYTKPVKQGEMPASYLADSIILTGAYMDADGGRQVIEVMAEAIQAKGVAGDGIKAVVKAWGVDPETLVIGGAGR